MTPPTVPAPGTGLLELLSLTQGTWDRWGAVIGAAVPLVFIAVFVAPVLAAVFPMFAIWLERKVSAHMQSRLGPMEVGWHGWLQTLADGVKLLAKEDLIPAGADRALFVIGPVLTLAGVFVMIAVLPFGPHLISTDLNTGLFFLAAVGSIEVVGILMAGWASNNKWSLFGTMRLVTQLVSYEIPLGMSFLTVVALSGTLSMQEIIREQHGWIWNWFLFRNPFMAFVFIIYFIASLAETKRAPFDLPEAESELVAGFHTEYSGMRFSIFFLAEYVAMYVVSAIAATIFLGGWNTGISPLDAWLQGSSGGFGGEGPGLAKGIVANLVGMHVIFVKSWFLIFVQMWLRWTLPRIRLDQVMDLCLKFLLPWSVVFFVLSVGWELVPWRLFLPKTPVGEGLPRLAVFAVETALVGAWFVWFWRTFQAPLGKSMQEKPWLAS